MGYLRSRNTFVISDTHFNHSNILKFKNGRGHQFSDVNEMNEVMIENWNKEIKPSDKVYHLGDVFFGSKEEFSKLWGRLNGKKRLIVGNHDEIKFLSSGNFFQKVYMWRFLGNYNMLLSHVPLHLSSFEYRHKDAINIHGHTHWNGSPEGPYKSVCVELTDYKPVNIEELI